MTFLDRSRLRTYPLKGRRSKVHVSQFGRPHQVGDSVSRFLTNLPDFLGARDLLKVARSIVEVRVQGKAVSLAMGAHVVKVGLSPVIIDLFQTGWITNLATHGAGMVHDFEIALVGHTSEDVEATLGSGSFGMAEETGRILNEIIRAGVARGEGLGEAVGRGLLEMAAPHAEKSLLAVSMQVGCPMTIHIALGTDVNHLHPTADGAALGEGSYKDFLLFCERIASLDQGVHINLGSAVLLPEVFLKAVSLARNLGNPVRDITTVNMDFFQHYRPMTNVVRRPTAPGGAGYALTGHHELLVPLLAACIKEEAATRGVHPAKGVRP